MDTLQEQPTPIKCKFCGKENPKPQHENFCGKNPNNVRAKKKEKMAMIQESTLSTLPSPQLPGEPAPSHQKITITDVQGYMAQDDSVAWFVDGDGKRSFQRPGYFGIFSEGNDIIPSLLLCSENGTLMPLFMMDGFIGMFPEGKEWPVENVIPDEEEIFPQVPTEQTKEHSCMPTPAEIKAIMEEKPRPEEKVKKSSLLSRLFSGPSKKKAEKMDVAEVKALIEEAKNAST